MLLVNQIASQLDINQKNVAATIELLDADNTIPFIARYRKEVTGNLHEEQIRAIDNLSEQLRKLDERRQTILKSITAQGKLTSKLQERILAAESRTQLEDLYQPYKPKRKTRASKARECGLQPLADLILKQVVSTHSLSRLANPHLSEDIADCKQAWSGARDIVAETISDHSEVRSITREKTAQWGSLQSRKIEKAEDPRSIYKDYYDAEFRLGYLHPHQILAINRGEAEKVLRVKVKIPERDWRLAVNNYFRINRKSPFAEQLELAIEDAAKRILLPAIERDLRRELTNHAENHAIEIFANNLRNLLNQSPLPGHNILGIDPGFRTGCKLAVIDSTGKVLDFSTIYPHPPQNQKGEAQSTLKDLILKHTVTLIAIGNGTASRESVQLIIDLLVDLADDDLHYLIVSEAGASVYSASKLARRELPELDISIRGAVSIARRVQDPLAELVKIDPKSIGIGMYQHDVNQKALTRSLNDVVESVVNNVGVEINTASPALLTHVAGIGPTLAERIVDHRDQNGSFKDRASLKNVQGLGPKAFEQSAGFLRIQNGNHPLDNSAIHPESFTIAEHILKRAGLDLNSDPNERETALKYIWEQHSPEKLALEFDVGLPTLRDIFDQLKQPGRDPRTDFPPPILRSDVLRMDDLTAGLQLMGTVRNVVDFGAFIDIGVKRDGLLHRSQIPHGRQISVGNILEVKILNVDIKRGRISLGWENSNKHR